MVKWTTLILLILEVLASNLGLEISYSVFDRTLHAIARLRTDHGRFFCILTVHCSTIILPFDVI
jgi:hypothetical protein